MDINIKPKALKEAIEQCAGYVEMAEHKTSTSFSIYHQDGIEVSVSVTNDPQHFHVDEDYQQASE